MKRLINITGSLGIILLIVYLSISIYTDIKLDNVKEKVIENNPEISRVETVNSIGKWGEWFSEYVFVVDISGSKYRIWTSDEGEVTDKELLDINK